MLGCPCSCELEFLATPAVVMSRSVRRGDLPCTGLVLLLTLGDLVPSVCWIFGPIFVGEGGGLPGVAGVCPEGGPRRCVAVA